jgi:hypothetical protein
LVYFVRYRDKLTGVFVRFHCAASAAIVAMTMQLDAQINIIKT